MATRRTILGPTVDAIQHLSKIIGSVLADSVPGTSADQLALTTAHAVAAQFAFIEQDRTQPAPDGIPLELFEQSLHVAVAYKWGYEHLQQKLRELGHGDSTGTYDSVISARTNQLDANHPLRT